MQDPADAADITQEVFIKVFRSIRSFNGESSLRTWLYRIALHEAINQRRWWSRHKRRELTIDTPLTAAENDDGEDSMCLAGSLTDLGGTPYDHASRAEIRARIEDSLRKLPDGLRTAVVLREIEGFCYEEIAEILEIPLGTVKSRLKRGRVALKDLLVAEGFAGASAGCAL